VGYAAQGLDAEGRPVEHFINLPLGIAIDTMEHQPVRGQNKDWAARVQASNALISQLQGIGDQLQPGEEQEIALTIRIRRAGEPAATISTDDNPYAMDVSALLGTKVEPKVA